MSWSSKALPWLLPSVLLLAPISSTVVIVSPWVQDVELIVSRWDGQQALDGEVKLSQTLSWLHAERNLRFQFYVRGDQLIPHVDPRIADLRRHLGNWAIFHGITDLHAKMVVTNKTVIETSANLLTRSLYRNVESLRVFETPAADASLYVAGFFALHGVQVV